MRKETDSLGDVYIDDNCYYGANTLRALDNFNLSNRPVHKELVTAMVLVKKAAALSNNYVGLLNDRKTEAIVKACNEVLDGKYSEQFVVDAMQGGAGTSTNMNVNEVIANISIEILGGNKGDYTIVHPLDDVNMSQSTNDVFPTAVRIVAIRMLRPVSEKFAKLQTALQEKENEFSDVLKVGRTQLQDAVPIMLGQEFGAWAQAVARDRWRLYKVEERLRQVNIGGTAVGTGINANRKYIYMVIEKLRELTGLGLARAECMIDPTQNADVFVEVSGLLKASAVNLSKISNDLRYLSSGPRAGIGEITIPEVQAGSTIMPGKVNPVILEAVNQIAFKVIGNDVAITMAAQAGQLELNAFLPLIADNLFEMLDLLNNGIDMMIEKCIRGIKANREKCKEYIQNGYTLLTALSNHIGYDEVARLVKKCITEKMTVEEILQSEKVMEQEKLAAILDPFEMTKPGIPGQH